MATVEPTTPDPFEPPLEEPQEADTIIFEDLLSRDASNTVCITEENLDLVWPRDPDQEPAVIVGKWFQMPPTCVGEFIPCEEKYGRDTCLAFVFDGPDLPNLNAQVPAPAAGILLLTALVGAAAYKKVFK